MWFKSQGRHGTNFSAMNDYYEEEEKKNCK